MDPIERGAQLQHDVEQELPDFVKALRTTNAEAIVIHQDTFAADYQDAELLLLGKAIKYAGIFGKEIHIIGRNRQTLEQTE